MAISERVKLFGQNVVSRFVTIIDRRTQRELAKKQQAETGELWDSLVAQPGRKTADRPHWITIATGAFGVLSPILTVVALYISYQSLQTSHKAVQTSELSVRTSEQSMKVGQRAYLTLRNGKMKIGKPGELPPNIRTIFPPGHRNLPFILYWEFDAYNAGNTPAVLGQSRLALSERDWGARVDESRIYDGSTWVGSKATNHVRGFTYQTQHDERSLESFSGFLKKNGAFNFEGTLHYSDIFGDDQQITWCWVFGNSFDHPLQCPVSLPQTPSLWFPYPPRPDETK